jgi:hypothetical protein
MDRTVSLALTRFWVVVFALFIGPRVASETDHCHCKEQNKAQDRKFAHSFSSKNISKNTGK